MYEIDKAHFGEFLLEQRKAKGYTQKELAQKLFVSDKAVSKWERGISMPDISLLIPLADILEVTVTELLEGEALEEERELDTERVEQLVKKALAFSEETPENVKRKKKKHRLIYGLTCLCFALELLVSYLFGYTFADFFGYGKGAIPLIGIFFGAYFWLIVKEKLPAYYDENPIDYYSDWGFQMHMPGIHFNNSNWGHIVKVMRIWSVVSITVYPVINMISGRFLSGAGIFVWSAVVVAAGLGGLFIPVYVVGKKYE